MQFDGFFLVKWVSFAFLGFVGFFLVCPQRYYFQTHTDILHTCACPYILRPKLEPPEGFAEGARSLCIQNLDGVTTLSKTHLLR